FFSSRGDFDHSGNTDASDFDAWYSHVGLVGLPLVPDDFDFAATAAVPEPVSLALLALGAIPLVVRRRTRPPVNAFPPPPSADASSRSTGESTAGRTSSSG